jgi:hypothetical protein
MVQQGSVTINQRQANLVKANRARWTLVVERVGLVAVLHSNTGNGEKD